jgi:2-polyprenyl-6-methoxyphenol hydroxylase-like FAD-dependent oxidoreductase
MLKMARRVGCAGRTDTIASSLPEDMTTQAALSEAMAAHWPDFITGLVRHSAGAQMVKIYTRSCSNVWYRQRAVLAGDAAHSIPPTTLQVTSRTWAELRQSVLQR